jgi:predicted signal transduction protein with EAL and GGDEF domain/ABC-type amino acid transport substrate-binding protein
LLEPAGRERGKDRIGRPGWPAWTAWLLLFASALAGATADPPGPVVLGGDRDYPPMHYLDAGGAATGFDVELFRAVAAEAGFAVDFKLADWAGTLDRLESGSVHVVPMFVSAQRSRRFLFSAPFLRRYHLVFGRAGSEFVPGLETLAGRRVAVQYGGLGWETLTAAAQPVAVVPVDVESDAVAAVARGEADYALVPMMVGYHAVLRHKLQGIVVLSPPVLEADYAFAVSPRHAGLLPRIDRALNRVTTSGRQDLLYLEWLANLHPPAENPRSGLATALWVGLPLLVGSVMVLGHWRRARRHAQVHAQRAEREALLRQDLEARARYLAFHDPQSGLPNRNALHHALEAALARERPASMSCALLRIDLIGLDMIRTIAGPGFSNEVVAEVGARLRRSFGEAAAFHIGRGEFAVIVGEVADAAAAEAVLRRAVSEVHRRMTLDELTLEQRCRIGLALHPAHGNGAEPLLRAAEMACAAAHERNLVTFEYVAALEPDPRNLHLLSDLHEAIEQQSLGYALQPKLDLVTRRVIGAEMLVRWHHPRFGAVAPAHFVPLAEKTGLIGELTRYLVHRALVHLRDWQRLGLDLTLSVNVSVNDLADAALVDDIIARSGELGAWLILEVTETDVMRDGSRVLAAVERLRGCGIRISLDDFGTGWSSLTYLREMAPDELKIDRCFIADLLQRRSDQAIVRAIIQLAHHLGATVTAEGIEDDATLEWLVRAGCDTAQGFSIGRPVDIAELTRASLTQTGTHG